MAHPVAETILAQLGGSRFRAMTGAHTFTGSEDSLSFRVGSNAKRVCGVRVTLTPADLYTVSFLKMKGGLPYVARTVEGVYADNLAEVFTDATGLYTTL